MKRLLPLLAAGFSISAIYAQTCPSPNFLQGSTVTLFDLTSVAGLQRQPDGSFTRQRYQIQSPHKKLDSAPNYQSAFLNCSAAGARAFQTAPGWIPLADQPGAASRTVVASDFLGNGTLVGLAVIAGGQPGGPSADSLLVVVFNADRSLQSNTIRSPRTRKVCWWRT
jgi:hypothetical protein